ncbi:MAG: efflux RND transporter permease subunit [Syntrophaceae bacterium]|nr:efflux RND transporter permease subunit [Syntrophaceae bacterium]
MKSANDLPSPSHERNESLISRLVRFWIQNKLPAFILLVLVAFYGIVVAPFDWEIDWLPRNPVPVDAIPDIGENQQIVFTVWEGRSPKDIENQITYPLTVTLLGIPGVKAVRSNSFFGFSSIYIIFNENVEFYWSRSRILEKINSLPSGLLPEGVQPTLGPDATALGQVFLYTVEGEGFGLDELRTIQDYYIRYSLQSSGGVSEVASIGGYVKEYQVDVNPDAMRAHGVTLPDVYNAVRMSNIDVGAGVLELNRVEYTIRGLGFIKSVSDLENSVVKVNNNVPLFIKDVATVQLGPAMRRGALDKEGAEVVGGVVVVRYGENPLQVIKNVKSKIAEISPGLPSKTLQDGSVSQVKILPFYDRTELIHETLETLNKSLVEEIFVTIIVVIVMMNHLVGSLLISSVLPLAVLLTFIAMKLTGIDANIMALSGIAIAIGVMVDMGIILCENIIRRLEEDQDTSNLLDVIHRSTMEVGSAIITSSLTTIISFLPVFTLTGPEGKLFKPVAFTKTFAVAGSLILALALIPPLAHIVFRKRNYRPQTRLITNTLMILIGVWLYFGLSYWIGIALIVVGAVKGISLYLRPNIQERIPSFLNILALMAVVLLLTKHWLPLGPDLGFLRNLIFVSGMIFGLLSVRRILTHFYGSILGWSLNHKALFMMFPALIVIFGGVIWLGFDRVFGFFPWAYDSIFSSSFSTTSRENFTHGQINPIKQTRVWSNLSHAFPGLGKEFMPDLDEGSFLFMPTTMPHASISEALDVIQKQDMAIRSIPEVTSVVGKIGRVESALDPAPISMIETIINYAPEYQVDPLTGERIVDPQTGKPIRNWRPHIKSSADIWKEITEAARMPGVTSAPKLQPIAARIVMLQSGMRASMGVKIKGKSIEDVEKVGFEIEKFLKEVPVIDPSTVVADRLVGNPYLEFEIDRKAIARFGLPIQDVQNLIEIAVGGKTITTTVEGRERYPVRVRYQRELRDSIEALEKFLITTPDGTQVPISSVATLRYSRGPMSIKSEDTFLTGYVLFDKRPGNAEVDVVNAAQSYLRDQISAGSLKLPDGSSFSFAGSYENQVRSEKTLRVVIPMALMIIFLVLYFQFHSIPTSLNVFSGIFVAWSGGFIMLWLYAQPGFLNFEVFGVNMRDVFQVRPYNLSVAVWVGFLALFGVATNDGVIYSTYLDQVFRNNSFKSVSEIRQAVIEAGCRRVRPALMTTATTILALIPVLTSKGKGSDVMAPMAIPCFGGMAIDIITIFVVPTIYCWGREIKMKRSRNPKSS